MHHSYQAARLRELIDQSHNIVVLTGAGVSTESGIPDFRSSGGLWEDEELLEAMSDDYLTMHPRDFWPKFKHVFLREEFLKARPNMGHLALRELELWGKDVTIFTQNVDGLHIDAGSTKVFEMHGTVRAAECPVCRTHYNLDFILSNDVPQCEWFNVKGGHCGAVIHPDTVLFGQDVRHYEKAAHAMRECDLALVLGTSLTVDPVASLPIYIRKGHGKLAVVNLEPTYCDRFADVVVHDRVGEFLHSVINEISA